MTFVDKAPGPLIAAVERKLGDGGRDHLAVFARIGLEHCCGAGDVHRFRNDANLQCEIHACRAPTSTFMSAAISLLKPFASAVSVYVPILAFENVNSPLSSVVVLA